MFGWTGPEQSLSTSVIQTKMRTFQAMQLIHKTEIYGLFTLTNDAFLLHNKVNIVWTRCQKNVYIFFVIWILVRGRPFFA